MLFLFLFRKIEYIQAAEFLKIKILSEIEPKSKKLTLSIKLKCPIHYLIFIKHFLGKYQRFIFSFQKQRFFQLAYTYFLSTVKKSWMHNMSVGKFEAER